MFDIIRFLLVMETFTYSYYNPYLLLFRIFVCVLQIYCNYVEGVTIIKSVTLYSDIIIKPMRFYASSIIFTYYKQYYISYLVNDGLMNGEGSTLDFKPDGLYFY